MTDNTQTVTYYLSISTMGLTAKILIRKTSRITIAKRTAHPLREPPSKSCGRTARATAATIEASRSVNSTVYPSATEPTPSSPQRDLIFIILTRIYPKILEFNWTSKRQQQRKCNDSSMPVQPFNLNCVFFKSNLSRGN